MLQSFSAAHLSSPQGAVGAALRVSLRDGFASRGRFVVCGVAA